MTVLPIVLAPDRLLKTPCRPVGRVDASVRRLMDDMLETRYAAPGVGLAAPQVGVLKRVIVADVAHDDEPPAPLRLADPEIVWTSDEQAVTSEGCLSLPEIYVDVTRPVAVRVRFLDEHGETREIEAEDLLARCLQHEIDHLNGVLHVDYLSHLKRTMILRRLAKQKPQPGSASGRERAAS